MRTDKIPVKNNSNFEFQAAEFYKGSQLYSSGKRVI